MLEAGLRFTAIGSAIAIGCESSSSGGNFSGNKASFRLPNRHATRLSCGSSRPTGIGMVVNRNSGFAGNMSSRFRPCEGSREGLRSGFVSAGLPITVFAGRQNPSISFKNEKQSVFHPNPARVLHAGFAGTYGFLPNSLIASSNLLSYRCRCREPRQQSKTSTAVQFTFA
jgi:hypothetical protein